MRKPSIPKRVCFGLGFVVPVVRKDKLRGARGTYQTSARGGPMIELEKSTDLAQLFEDYAHEVLHAAIDFQLYVLQEIAAPIRAEVERERARIEHEEEER